VRAPRGYRGEQCQYRLGQRGVRLEYRWTSLAFALRGRAVRLDVLMGAPGQADWCRYSADGFACVEEPIQLRPRRGFLLKWR